MLNIHKRGDDELPPESGQPAEKPAEKSAEAKKKTEKSVTIYIAILFAVVILLLFLSYFIQERRNSDTISDLTEQHSAFSTQALQNIEELQNKNLTLAEELEAANKQIEDLQEELEKAETELGEKRTAFSQVENKVKEAENRYLALDKLLEAEAALEEGDREKATALAQEIEELKSNLDEKYAARYQTVVDELSE